MSSPNTLTSRSTLPNSAVDFPPLDFGDKAAPDARHLGDGSLREAERLPPKPDSAAEFACGADRL